MKTVARKVAKKLPVTPVAKKIAKVISKNATGDLDKRGIHETVKELAEDLAKEAAETAAAEAAKTVA